MRFPVTCMKKGHLTHLAHALHNGSWLIMTNRTNLCVHSYDSKEERSHDSPKVCKSDQQLADHDKQQNLVRTFLHTKEARHTSCCLVVDWHQNLSHVSDVSSHVTTCMA